MERLRPHAVPDRPARGPEQPALRTPDAFLLARTIGNRATASLLQRDTPTDAPRTFADKGSGHSVRRIRLTGVTGGGFTDVAIAILPDNLPQDGGPVDVLVYLGGFHVRGAHGYGTEGGKEADDVAFHKIPQQLAAAGRPMVAILPSNNATSDFNPDKDKQGFDADTLIGDVFGLLGKEWGTPKPPTPGRVIMSGHSGADVAMSEMISGGKMPKHLGGFLLFDTMWEGVGHEDKIWAATEKALEGNLSSLRGFDIEWAGDEGRAETRKEAWVKAEGFRLFDVYGLGGKYDASGAALAQKRNAWLRRADVQRVIGKPGSPVYEAMAANLVVKPGDTDHDHKVGAHLKRALDGL